jgi:hypothetical protein
VHAQGGGWLEEVTDSFREAAEEAPGQSEHDRLFVVSATAELRIIENGSEKSHCSATP